MPQNFAIQEELDELKVSFNAGLTTDLSVPSGYFDQFAESLSDMIQDEAGLMGKDFSSPLEVPATYFDGFEGELLNQIKSNSLESYSREMPYNVPENYFLHFDAKIQSLIHQKNQLEFGVNPSNAGISSEFHHTSTQDRSEIRTNQLKITKRKLSNSLAIAASILIILTFSFFMFNTSSTESKQALVNHTIESQLDKLTVTEVDEYIQQNQSEFISDISAELPEDSDIDINKLENEILDSQLKNFTTEELSNYL